MTRLTFQQAARIVHPDHPLPSLTIELPKRVRHAQTSCFAADWNTFDLLLDDWEYRSHPVHSNGEQGTHEYRIRRLTEGCIVVYPPVGIPRPETRVCPHCRGLGSIAVNAAAVLADPQLCEEDLRHVPCTRCEGDRVVPRDERRVVLPITPGDFGGGRVAEHSRAAEAEGVPF